VIDSILVFHVRIEAENHVVWIYQCRRKRLWAQ
jgi:hypothetical protein